MKPKDLKFPFSWEERKPCIQDKVLFIPKYYHDHEVFNLPDWEDKAFFGRSAPLAIEYCSGNGQWIIEKAKAFPDINWIAVEKKFERVRKIWSKAHNSKFSNLVIICGNAEDFTSYYLKESSIEQVFINFPDPWPKDRHAKNRLLQLPFAKSLSKVVKPLGEALFVTDDNPYCLQMISAMHETNKWKSKLEKPYFLKNIVGYGTSYFNELWKGKGRDIHHLHFLNHKN